MRTNLPVTNHEVQLTDATLIVSKTDLKGRITYVNKDFLDISGYSEAELIGEPHNLVRHPDMPVEAFPGPLGHAQGRTALDRLRQEPLQKWRLLLGAGQCRTRSRERPGHRLHLGARKATPRQRSMPTKPSIASSAKSGRASLKIRFGKAVKPALIEIQQLEHCTQAVVPASPPLCCRSDCRRQLVARHASRPGAVRTFPEPRTKAARQPIPRCMRRACRWARRCATSCSTRPIARPMTTFCRRSKDFQQQLALANGVPDDDPALRKFAGGDLGKLSAQHFGVHDRVVDAVKANDLVLARKLLNEEDTPLWRQYKQLLLDGRAHMAKSTRTGPHGTEGDGIFSRTPVARLPDCWPA
jgi:hypothetical protein